MLEKFNIIAKYCKCRLRPTKRIMRSGMSSTSAYGTADYNTALYKSTILRSFVEN